MKIYSALLNIQFKCCRFRNSFMFKPTLLTLVILILKNDVSILKKLCLLMYDNKIYIHVSKTRPYRLQFLIFFRKWRLATSVVRTRKLRCPWRLVINPEVTYLSIYLPNYLSIYPSNYLFIYCSAMSAL